ncbi:PQQ-dependent sugar dehydrogenase [Anthocerotibacter panamensis]|uniref:PQQ-dependent sugar dehydrogenase n=1 Tax=Anthocerotibacter panamensis TaxID=2857077 RepID=UPI001C404764|nr:PQQ-dependent sugar dehydrogenase [Anthocerotibacter panamensis]
MRHFLMGLLTLGGLAISAAALAQSPLRVEPAFSNLTFTNPLDIQHPPDGSERLLVVEQGGQIRVFANTPAAQQAGVFLDLGDRVLAGGELGLLGLAFHPDYAQNGYFYLNYTADNPRRTVIARYQVDPGDPNRANPASESILLTIDQPYANHNGGQLAFGPDGYLYIGLGDGGSGGDPLGNAQNRATLLGKLLRIDVDNPAAGKNYGIPPDNPLVGNTQGYREEIYAYGLRNPWRFSFDPPTGRLWLADVGQDAVEEVDLIEKGQNYGWNLQEGSTCYRPGCLPQDYTAPITEYGHDLGTSITGGYVYRGQRLAQLVGAYIFADFGSGRIWAFDNENRQRRELLQTDLKITSFGIDRQNELYFSALDGKIYHLAVVNGRLDSQANWRK